MRECIKNPQLSTLAEAAATNASTTASCGQPTATAFNNRLNSDWGSGGRWPARRSFSEGGFESSHPDQFVEFANAWSQPTRLVATTSTRSRHRHTAAPASNPHLLCADERFCFGVESFVGVHFGSDGIRTCSAVEQPVRRTGEPLWHQLQPGEKRMNRTITRVAQFS